MTHWPRVSIVTPVSGRAPHVGDAIESVARQDYPNLEHIVVDGRSPDERLASLPGYPHVTVLHEADHGPGHALNRGFNVATGDIWGVLEAHDVLAPEALRRVAREIDPGKSRHVVMGRCRFVDGRGNATGVELSSRFEGHRRVLEVWKGRTIPPPSVFWTPEAWRTGGAMDGTLGPEWMAYDLFCRFSRSYPLQFVDQVLAECRMHRASRLAPWPEPESLEAGIMVSRRYWGSPLTPRYWALAFSLARFRFDRVGRARRHLAQMEDERRRAPGGRVIYRALVGTILAPEVAWCVVIFPRLRDRTITLWAVKPWQRGGAWSDPPETTAYLRRTEVWSDAWAGPRAEVTREVEPSARAVVLSGWAEVQYMTRRLVLTVRVDNKVVGRHHVKHGGDFSVRMRLAAPLAPGAHTVAIEASTWFVPHRFTGNEDLRPLAWRVGEIALEAGPRS